ncbi:MAG: diguanylate cyclase, partial [Candidatus Eremiobacterota bacterium]
MFNSLTIIIILIAYSGLLFFTAMWVEKKFHAKSTIVNNAIIYSLSLTVYCTTWAYYGSIGKTATSGLLFVTIFLGPTITFVLGWTFLRKLIRIKRKWKITSIADFISARYGKSQLLAATVTCIALIGIAPYIALQLKSLISTLDVITATVNHEISWIHNYTGFIIVIILIILTNLFGVRRLSPAERHPGIIFVIAIEAIVKLAAFVIAGVFITYFIYNGFGDIFNRATEKQLLVPPGNDYYITWMTYIILSMSACIFLPRQFHVAVVENFSENHIRTAMWLFPLYMFLINIFVLPVALAGLLKGYSVQQADTFLLSLPVSYGHRWISLLVFLGGFSAGTSMIIISSMTLSTMIINHLILPITEYIKKLTFLKRHILKCRWVAVAMVILLGYWFERKIGNSYMLVNIGTISFAAIIQFAPSIIGGILWHKGNKTGALLGLMSGFIIWFYTLLLPSFIKSGWLSETILKEGPYGIGLFKPEQLLGLTVLDPLSHSVFWSLFFNINLYVLSSLYFKQSEEEYKEAIQFVNILNPSAGEKIFTGNQTMIKLEDKINILNELLSQYFSKSQAREIIETVFSEFGLTGKEKISLENLADIYSEFEKKIAGIIGSPSAHMTMKKVELFTKDEAKKLTELYAETISEFKITPEELKRKIDYYREKEELLRKHSRELEKKIKEREDEIVLRKKMEEE